MSNGGIFTGLTDGLSAARRFSDFYYQCGRWFGRRGETGAVRGALRGS